MIYQKQWGFLKNNFELGNLAHAFLFSGQDINSIEKFTKDFVKLINGKEYEAMIDNETFPDLLIIRSQDSKSSKDNERDMMDISIEQIRSAQNFLAYKAYYGNFKSVIIENAEGMNAESQSALLKTLEEPKGKTIIFLLTSKPDVLLQTIYSRCQQIKFLSNTNHVISKEEEVILQGLKKVMHSDLAEKFNFAKNINLENRNFNKIINVLQKYFREQMLQNIGIIKKNPQIEGQAFAFEQVKIILRSIETIFYQTNAYNINKKLALEILLLEL